MATSKYIAGLIGPTLMALALSETIHLRIWTTSIPSVVYLNGAVLFVAGLAIVRSHNRWTAGWPVLVTLVGWVAVLGGLFRMFAPEARQAGQNAATFAGFAAVFAIGVFLTFKAYNREGS